MGLRRVLAQSRALVRKMLARPEQGDPGAEASAERVQRRFSDLVDTCSRFARDIARDAGWNGGSASLFDPRDRPDRPKAEMAMHPGDEPSRLDRVKGIVHSRRTLRNDLIQP